MRYRYYVFGEDPMFSGMAVEDSGTCYSRDELDETIGHAMQDDGCFYFAWERLDGFGEPAGDLHVEKDIGGYRKYQSVLKGRMAMRRKGFWQEVERDGLDYDWHFDGDGWTRHYPFGMAVVRDNNDIDCGWGYQLFDYDGKCSEHIKYVSPDAAKDAADIEAEELGFLGDGGLVMSKKDYIAGYMAAYDRFAAMKKRASYDITRVLNMFEYPLDVTTREWLGSDYSYRKLVRTVNEAERYNYQSDYWGDADDYQADNVALMAELEDLVGQRCSVRMDGDVIEGTLEGILIDKQYNSVSHTDILFSDVDE